MVKVTDTAVSKILGVFEAAYRIKFRPQEARVWQLLLKPIGDKEGMEAALALCRQSPYVPKPADIFRIAGDMREATRVRPWMPALPEPASPEVAEKYLGFIREAMVKIGKPMPQ